MKLSRSYHTSSNPSRGKNPCWSLSTKGNPRSRSSTRGNEEMRRREDGKDEQGSTEKAKEHPEASDVVIGMQDEKGRKGT
jgi:hypothetical protein